MAFNNNVNSEERRAARRKRRIRNQIIAYVVLVVLIAGGAFGGYKAGRYIIAKAAKAPVVSEDSASASEDTAVSEDVAGVIATPEETIEPDIEEDTVEVTEKVENEKARAYVDNMSLEQKVASLFMISPEALTGVDAAVKAGDGTRSALSEYAVAGLIYSNKNIKGADQFKEMLANTQSMYHELYNSDAWLAVQEEGAVNTIAGSAAGVTSMPSASEIGSGNDSSAAYQSYVTIGSYLADYGINMDLGICADVVTDDSSFIASRAFGSDADLVAEMVEKSVDGLVEMKVHPVLMGFVGRGDAKDNTVAAPSMSARTLEQIKEADLKPFYAGIEKGAEIIQLSNITLTEISGELPASLSPEVINIARDEMSFDGVLMTGRMDESAITDKYNSKEAAVMAICAGADIIVAPQNFKDAYTGILEAVNDGTISEERIDQSLMRVYSIKFAE